MCINTQTPVVRFTPRPPSKEPQTSENSTDLSAMVEGVDYSFSPGGVTRMVFPLVKRMLSDGTADYVHWVSLNPSAPETIRAGRITFHSISLEKEKLKSYGNVKETIWGAAHGTNPDTLAAEDIFWSEDFTEYTYYNRLSAELIRDWTESTTLISSTSTISNNSLSDKC